MREFFTEILPWFMDKYGWDILGFELTYILPFIILWLTFSYSIKLMFRGGKIDD